MPNLFSKADLFDDAGDPLVIDLPPSLEAARLAPYFRRAEAENLGPLIGEQLLGLLGVQVVDPLNPTPTERLLARLRTASTMFVGLHALAKYWPFSQTSVTSHGTNRKLADQSEPIDAPTLTRQQTEFLNSAKVYEASLRKFLDANRLALDAVTNTPASATCGPGQSRISSAPVTILPIRKPGRDERFF